MSQSQEDADEDAKHMFWCMRRGTAWDWQCCDRAVGPIGNLHEMLVRTVLAQQWEIAIRLHDDGADHDDWSAGWDSAAESIAEMRCAVDVVNDLMGAV